MAAESIQTASTIPSLAVVTEVAALCSATPDEKNVGRDCYAFTEMEDQAFARLEGMCREMFNEYDGLVEGLDWSLETDGIGNMYVTFFGKNTAKAIMVGSHLDSVLNGGMYDGVAGVNAGFNYLRQLCEAKLQGREPEQNFILTAFRAEESSPKTGHACLGSAVACGGISAEKLANIGYDLGNGAKMPFKEYFTDRYGEPRWQQVMRELQDPIIKSEHVSRYLELHIEQSAVVETAEADLGIVIKGIGGSVRDEVNFVLSKGEAEHVIEDLVQPGDMELTVKFFGQEAHTGGTPPNTVQYWSESNPAKNRPWYRNDALVAAQRFIEELYSQAPGAQIMDISVPEKTGFTTVPPKQTVKLIINKAQLGDDLWPNLAQVTADAGCTFTWAAKELQAGSKISYLRPAFAGAMLGFADLLENKARTELNSARKSQPNDVGGLRLTTTDFRLDAEHLDGGFNFDMRDVLDADTRGAVLIEVREELGALLVRFGIDLADSIRHRSDVPYVPVDDSGANELVSTAKNLGFKAVTMPSLPGHDSKSLGKIGVPINMIFVRHPGTSHSPLESMPVEHYASAEMVLHDYLNQLLNLTS